jgi:hypothetical protein
MVRAYSAGLVGNPAGEAMEWESGTHLGKQFFCTYRQLPRGGWHWEFQVDDDGPEGVSCFTCADFEAAQMEAAAAARWAIAASSNVETVETFASNPLVAM